MVRGYGITVGKESTLHVGHFTTILLYFNGIPLSDGKLMYSSKDSQRKSLAPAPRQSIWLKSKAPKVGSSRSFQ